MSQASEWAARRPEREATRTRLRRELDALTRAPVFLWEGRAFGEVTEGGRLMVCAESMPPPLALALARWILDTFGEEAPCPTSTPS